MASAQEFEQLFNDHDLFISEAVGEDGPCDGEEGKEVLPEELLKPISPEKQPNPEPNTSAVKDTLTSNRNRQQATRVGGFLEKAEAPHRPRVTHEPSSLDISDAKARKAAKRRLKLKQQRDIVLYWLETKYDVLPEVIQAVNSAWQQASCPDDDMDLLWSDTAISVDRFTKMLPYQKVNHFVGMTSITRKNNLGRNLLRMKRRFPEEYNFFPDTWILPTDLSDFKSQFTGKRNKTFIVKPSDGYQGRGIFLTRDFENITLDYNSTLVVQRYIHKPYLLDGHKFDFRLYVLVTGCDPLRIYLHQHGLVRLASEEYTEPKGKNLQNTMVHLTNYAINCDNPNFEENQNPEDGSDGHKRSFQAVLTQFAEDGVDVQKLMAQIEDLIVKTLMAVQPSLAHVYRSCQPDDVENAMCFEILGFDVMMDVKAKPWLIEVNHAPSFRAETELDRLVKFQVLSDAFELLNISHENRRRYLQEQQKGLGRRLRGEVEKRSVEERQQLEDHFARLRDEWESTIKNGYQRLYPSGQAKTTDYDRYAEGALDIWETLTGTNLRKKCKKDADEDGASGRRMSEDSGRQEKKKPVNRKTQSAEKLTQNGAGAKVRREEGAGTVSAATQASLPDVSTASQQPVAKLPKHHDILVGDTIHVQTNFGWEAVLVKKKHESGPLDIQFEDGETMREVMPRILKNATAQTRDRDSKTCAPVSANQVGIIAWPETRSPVIPNGLHNFSQAGFDQLLTARPNTSIVSSLQGLSATKGEGDKWMGATYQSEGTTYEPSSRTNTRHTRQSVSSTRQKMFSAISAARAKMHPQMRPVLPPKRASTCGASSMVYRPALAIVAHGVHNQVTRD